MARERWAWDWARKNALIWTDAMERHAAASLAGMPRAPIRARYSAIEISASRVATNG